MALDIRRLTLTAKKHNTSYRVPHVSSTLTSNVFLDGLAVSALYIAVPQSNGQVHILPKDAQTYDSTKPYIVDAVPGMSITDIQFSPQQPNVLAVASNTVIRVFNLPADGVLSNAVLSKPSVEIQGAGFTTLTFAKLTAGMAAVSTANGIALVDLNTPADNTDELIQRDTVLNFPLPNITASTSICKLNFSANEKYITAIGKDGALYIINPLQTTDVIAQQSTFADVIKFPQYATFIQEQTSPNALVFVAGLNSMKKPRWTAARFDTTTNTLAKYFAYGDFAASSGQILAHFDVDTQLLAITTRSSQTVSIFDTTHLNPAKSVNNLIPILNAPITTTKGLSFAPKSSINVQDTEVIAFYSHAGTLVEQYTLSVMKKDRGYSADIHPDTYDGSKVAFTIEQYLNGDVAPVPTKTLNPYVFTAATTSAAAAPKASNFDVATATAESSTAVSPVANTLSQNKDLFEKGFDKNTRAVVDAKFSRSTFVHCSGKEPGFNKDAWMCYDVNTTSQHISFGKTLNGNEDFYVIPTKTQGGGVLYPRLVSATGRAPTNFKAIRNPAQISAVAVAPQFANPKRQVAVAGDDGVVRIYELPLDWKTGELPNDITEAKYTYELGCRIQSMTYNPYVEDVLVCSGFVAEMGKEVLFLFDTSQPGVFQAYEDIIEDRVVSFNFSPDGCHLAIGDKKNNVVIITVPSAQIRLKFKHGQSPKEVWPLWYSNEYLVTVGYATGGTRAVSLHKVDWSTCTLTTVKTESFYNNYLLIPYLDRLTGVLVLAGVGTANMNIFFIDPSATTTSPIDNLSVFSSRDDVVGMQFLEKRYCNVREVEVIRAYKLSQKNTVWPVQFTVPRKRKEFFQDDIFATGAFFSPLCTTQQFFNAEVENAVTSNPQQTQFALNYKSLQPADMTPLSEAPEEELTERQQRYLQNKHKEFVEEQKVGFLGHKNAEEVENYYTKKMNDFGVYDRFSAKQSEHNDVSDSEWD